MRIKNIVWMLALAASFFICGSCEHTRYGGSFDANIDEIYFLADKKECHGMCATKWTEKLTVKTPPLTKDIYLRVRADDYVSENIVPEYPFTDIKLPANKAKIVSIEMVTGALKLTGTLYREDDEMELSFDIFCGNKTTVDGVTTCQLPVNSSLRIEVDMKEKGNVAVLSSLCNFSDIRKDVIGLQTFLVKGNFCPISVGVKDNHGKRYGSVLLRTATKTYIPIKNPIIDEFSDLCASDDVDAMEVEYKDEFQSVGNESCIEGTDYDVIYLWDKQNARFGMIYNKEVVTEWNQ